MSKGLRRQATREQLSGSLRAAAGAAGSTPLVHEGVREGRGDDVAVPGWAQGLLGIADWLDNADQVSALALSRTATLVAEVDHQTSATAARHDVLGELIWWVADAMQLCPPHEWACPVVSKLEPERTAWTCRRCGHTATSPDLRLLPD